MLLQSTEQHSSAAHGRTDGGTLDQLRLRTGRPSALSQSRSQQLQLSYLDLKQPFNDSYSSGRSEGALAAAQASSSE